MLLLTRLKGAEKDPCLVAVLAALVWVSERSIDWLNCLIGLADKKQIDLKKPF